MNFSNSYVVTSKEVLKWKIFLLFGSTMMNSWAKQLESAMFMQAKAKIH